MKSESQYGIAPIFIIILLVLVAAGAYFLGTKNQLQLPFLQNLSPTPTPSSSPLPSENSDWNTYKDDREGIEFSYPKDWHTLRYDKTTFSVFLDVAPIKIPEASEFITPILVGYNEATNTLTNERFFEDKTLEEGVQRYQKLFDANTVKVTRNLSIGGKVAAQISGKLGPGLFEGEYFKYTLIQMDGKLLIVQLFGTQHEAVYNQILDTFKFTK